MDRPPETNPAGPEGPRAALMLGGPFDGAYLDVEPADPWPPSPTYLIGSGPGRAVRYAWDPAAEVYHFSGWEIGWGVLDPEQAPDTPCQGQETENE